MSDAFRPAILVLIQNAENVELLTALFGEKFHLILERDYAAGNRDYDLCIVDRYLSVELKAQLLADRQISSHVYLPSLVLIGPNDSFDAEIRSYDDALKVPCTKAEIVHRVQSLLRARRFSLDKLELLAALKGQVSGLKQDILEKTAEHSALVETAAEATAANETKSSFLANMSHEIRTPLSAILGYSELAKDQTLSEAERGRFLDIVTRNGNALTRIIDDILDLAKVEAGKLMIEKISFSLTTLIEDVAELFREKALSKSLSLEIQSLDSQPTILLSDPTRIRQILMNLVGNAIKFTNRGGVTVQASSKAEGESLEVKILIKDTGLGITPEQQARLFEPFSQADDSTTRIFGGTGLGLVIARRLAQALGGDIEIVKSSSAGTTFLFHFKATLSSQLKTASAEKPRSSQVKLPDIDLTGFKILLVDDSADNQFLAKRILSKAGAVVEVANDGFEAIDSVSHSPFDLVLMDVQMPNMDGYTATRKLRESGVAIPIIALTAHAMAEDIVKTRAAGCNGHLTKPLDRMALLRTVHDHIVRS